MKVGDLVRWFDPWKVSRLGLVVSTLNGDGYCDVLVGGKIRFCHEDNMELTSEGR